MVKKNKYDIIKKSDIKKMIDNNNKKFLTAKVLLHQMSTAIRLADHAYDGPAPDTNSLSRHSYCAIKSLEILKTYLLEQIDSLKDLLSKADPNITPNYVNSLQGEIVGYLNIIMIINLMNGDEQRQIS